MTDQTKEPSGLPMVDGRQPIIVDDSTDGGCYIRNLNDSNWTIASSKWAFAGVFDRFPTHAVANTVIRSLAAPAQQPDEADQRYEAAMDFMESLAESQQPQQGEEGKLRDGGGRSNEE